MCLTLRTHIKSWISQFKHVIVVIDRWEVEESGSLKIQGLPSQAHVIKLLHLKTEISGYPLTFTFTSQMHMMCICIHIHMNTNINIYMQVITS